MSAITLVGTTSAVSVGAVSSLQVSVPTGTADGHVMLLAFDKDDDAGATTLTATGWTQIGADAGYQYFYRIASSEPANYTISISGARHCVAFIQTWAGVDTSNPIADYEYNTSVGTDTPTVPALSLSSAGYVLIAAIEGDRGGLTFTAPSGYTLAASATTAGSTANDASGALAYKAITGTSAGATTYTVSVSGSHPTAHIALMATSKRGVWIDWNQDGFDEGSANDGRLARMLPQGASVSDNITSDVISFNWTRGASSDHVGQPPPGTCTIVVQNDDGKYTPENSSGTLYGKLRPGLPVWIGRNADGTLSGTGTVHGVWAGYVRQIVPIPVAGATNTPTAEIICEDPLGWYARQPVKVAAVVGRSQQALRTAILDDIGEEDWRRDLAPEVDTLPLSAAAGDSALRVLEEINTATASRHSIEPGDTPEVWYEYRVVDRHHKLGSATDFTLNADNIQSSDGYRVTEENVVNIQQFDVSPARFPAGIDTVWTYEAATFPVGSTKVTIWAQFDDFVKDATLDYTSTGGAVTTTLTNFGTTAKIEIWSASTSVVANLTIEGRMVQRDASEAVTSEDATSQLTYGKRAGPTVSSAYVGTAALAQGVGDFIVWKFGSAHPRMNVSITNLLSTLNGRTLYDTTALTFDRLYLAGKRMEIIGEQGFCDVAVSASLIHWGVTYELQETANQSALSLFTLDTSTLNGSHVLGR